MVLIPPEYRRYFGLKQGDPCKIEEVTNKEVKITFE